MQTVRVPEFPAGEHWVRAVMASTLDGAVRGSDGGSRSISSTADQRWFAALRRGPQAILVGAGTVRAEDYRPSVRTVAIVTARLDLPPTLRMFRERTAEHARPIVLTTDEAAAHPPEHLTRDTDVIGCGSGHVDLRVALDALTARGLVHVQCEGGPRLLSDLIAADLLDELLLSLTPRLLGADDAAHIVHGAELDRRLHLVDVQQDEGTVLLRLGRR